MATQDLMQTELHGDSSAESSLDLGLEVGAPSLAPTGGFGSDDNSLRQALGPAIRDERFFKPREKNEFFKPPEKNDFAEVGTSFEVHRKLLAGTAVVTALGIAAVVYIWASRGEKTPMQSEQSTPAVQSSQASPEPSQASPEPSAQTASRKPETSPDPSVAVAWPDLPTSIAADTSAVVPVAPSATNTPRPTVSLSQKPEIVFLQRPGVNIRSAPSTNGRVVGKAGKGMRFKVTKREGDWVQVESDRFKGWINSQFLATNEPR